MTGAYLLIAVAVILALIGGLQDGTTGIATIGLSVVVALFASMAQAGHYHREMMERQERRLPE